MIDPCDITIQTYQNNFALYSQKTTNEVSGEFKLWKDEFLLHLKPGSQIFEVGSATGRDAKYFKSLGHTVFCTDVIPTALAELRNEGFTTDYYDVRTKIKPEWKKQFDAYYACASLIHVPKQTCTFALQEMKKILKPNSVGSCSFKQGGGSEITSAKLNQPRYFQYYSKQELITIFKELNITLLSITETTDHKWWFILFKI